VRSTGGRLAALIVGSSLAAAGYGAVLPYLYADVAAARGLGGFAAAGMFTVFALGSLVATPIAGRLADRRDPVLVATLARLGVVLAIALLAFASTTPLVWLAAGLYGAAVAATQPSIQVILLAWTPEHRRRDVFAWQFISSNLALALGGLAGGLVVDLSSAAGVRPIYYIAAGASLASAAAVWLTARGACAKGTTVDAGHEQVSYRALLRRPAIRSLLAVTVLLTLACYAQYESGLPAYALTSLHVSPRVLGLAVAVNAILVAALTAPVVALTRRREPTTLLAACAGLWIGCWALLALPLLHLGAASVLVVAGYAAISLGETMLSPVLSPLAAALAPAGAAGRTLAAVSGAMTLATAVGPALSGLLLALDLPAGFIALQLACCAGAIAVAKRLGRLLNRPVTAKATTVKAAARDLADTGSDEPVHPAVGVLELPGLHAEEALA
jgi:MFS family permease